MAHYYTETAKGVEARHFVQMASRNELRATRITDVRKWWREGQMVVPSVTTVLNVLDKAALVNWKIDQHLRIAYGVPIAPNESVDEWMRSVKRATELQMDKAPQAGTDMHKVLEDWIQGKDTPPEFDTICDNIGIELQRIELGADDREWEPEVYFTNPLGFGGCSDLVNRSHAGIVGDYKSKQTADKFKRGKMAYDDHRMQLAAYRMGFGLPQARCFNAFICLETGEVDIHWHTEDELSRGWEMFQHALAIWKLQNGWPIEFQEAA